MELEQRRHFPQKNSTILGSTTTFFLRYVDTKEHDYESDRELVRKLYKNHVEKSEEFDALLEEQSLYWNDDKEIVDSFVVKTIKRFQPENGAAQELLPAYAAQEDQEFAGRLFKITIERCDELRELVKNNLKKWQFNRIAFMDLVVMQIALAEMLEFPQHSAQCYFQRISWYCQGV